MVEVNVEPLLLDTNCLNFQKTLEVEWKPILLNLKECCFIEETFSKNMKKLI